MPNISVRAAGEAMPETLEDLIARHNAALAVANAYEGTFQGTPEEAELLAAVMLSRTAPPSLLHSKV